MSVKVAALLRRIPKTIRLGSDEYVIEKGTIPDHKNSWGMLDPQDYIISFDTNAPNPKQLAKTVLHEGLHGIWADRHIMPPAEEERIVDQFSAGLVAMFVDNPWMLPWLQAALRK